jgi:hypothetical protein
VHDTDKTSPPAQAVQVAAIAAASSFGDEREPEKHSTVIE